ncbi:hypothetical protein ACH5RR_002663 [Cinchona calisaya]|uniref:Protein kinase domain-containing protein n=1 Tax=Cinchona calisaya TaxID=153742 RepID=A0ABD3ASK4_9GENT
MQGTKFHGKAPASYRGILMEAMKQTKEIKFWEEFLSNMKKDGDLIKEFLTATVVLLKEEVRFLTDKTIGLHPNLVNVIGTCCEENVKGIVCDLDTLHNMMTTGYCLSRIHMISVGFRGLVFLLNLPTSLNTYTNKKSLI